MKDLMNTAKPITPSTDAIPPDRDWVVAATAQAGHTRTIQDAIDHCSAGGGGRVILRAGLHPSGTLVLRSGVTLHLEKDATLLASADLADYVHKEGTPTGLIFADQAQDIGLTGEGTIDGNGKAFRVKHEKPADWVEGKKPMGIWIPSFSTGSRPRALALILLSECRNVRMENLRVQDSTRWTIHLLACSDVLVRGLTVRSAVDTPNGDGFDLDGCSRVLMEDCDIETSDDAICLKTSRTWGLDRPCRDITVRRCRAFSTTHGFCIGHETQDPFANIEVSDVQIGGWGGFRTLTGIGLGSIDGATIQGVRLSNIHMTDVVAPFQIRLSSECRTYRGHAAATSYLDKKMHQRPPGELRDIAIEDITVTGATGNSFLSGLPGLPLHNLSLRNLRVQWSEAADPARIMNTVPELESEYPRDPMWRFLPAYGFFCRHIRGLELTNVTLTAVPGESRPALLIKDVGPFTCQNFQAIEPN